MRFLLPLLSLASLGLNLLPGQCAAVPTAALDNNVNHESLVVSRSAHEYGVDADEDDKRVVSRSAHVYGIDADEDDKQLVSRSAHVYGVDADEDEK